MKWTVDCFKSYDLNSSNFVCVEIHSVCGSIQMILFLNDKGFLFYEVSTTVYFTDFEENCE